LIFKMEEGEDVGETSKPEGELEEAWVDPK
jgi:hypothetical protein